MPLHSAMAAGCPGSTGGSCFRRWVPGLILAGGLLAGGWAHADGKVFAPRATPVEVRIPDQRAVLAWSNGVERLTIETSFAGAGTNFAWVVPLPAPPAITASTAGVFPTLAELMQPEVRHAVTRHFWWAVSLAGVGWILARIQPGRSMNWTDPAAALAGGAGLILGDGAGEWLVGWVIAGMLWVVAWRGRQRAISVVEAVTGLLVVLLLVTTLFPLLARAHAKAGGPGAEPAAGVILIGERQRVGVFESTTLSARDPAALRAWLNTNGFHLPPATEPVIAEYLRDGWVFVVSRLHPDAVGGDLHRLHPVTFTFPAREPVYPLRLTGVDNGSLAVELFVFGPGSAAAGGFRVRDCRPVDGAEPGVGSRSISAWRRPPRDVLPVQHESLRAAAGGGAWVTRLAGILTPDQMRRDAVIQWGPAERRAEVVYSRRGAVTVALNWLVPGLAIVVVGVALVCRVRRREPTELLPVLKWAALVSVAGGVVVYSLLPVVPVRVERRWRAGFYPHQLQYAVSEVPTNRPVTIPAVRASLRRSLAEFVEPGDPDRRLPLREEDSPFNYTLHEIPGGVEVRQYNYLGAVGESWRLPWTDE